MVEDVFKYLFLYIYFSDCCAITCLFYNVPVCVLNNGVTEISVEVQLLEVSSYHRRLLAHNLLVNFRQSFSLAAKLPPSYLLSLLTAVSTPEPIMCCVQSLFFVILSFGAVIDVYSPTLL